jgi:hypothetical protein
MATVRARRAGIPEGRGKPGAGKPFQLPLTLYDLIAAIQDIVGPGHDELVVATVRGLLRSGQVTRCGTGGVAERARCWGNAPQPVPEAANDRGACRRSRVN